MSEARSLISSESFALDAVNGNSMGFRNLIFHLVGKGSRLNGKGTLKPFTKNDRSIFFRFNWDSSAPRISVGITGT